MVRARYDARYPVDALLDRWHTTYDAIVARDGLRVKPGAVELIDWLERNAIPRACGDLDASRACPKEARERGVACALFATSSAATRSRAASPSPTSTSRRAPSRRRRGRVRRARGLRAGRARSACRRDDGDHGADLHAPPGDLIALDLLVLPSLHAVLDRLATLPA
jgi:hypothetical protein